MTNSETLRLNEVRARSNKEWEVKNTLESKATSIIQTAGTMATIIFGVVTFTLTSTRFVFPFYLLLAIAISILLCVGCIIICLLAIRIKDFYTPVQVESYFSKKNGRIEYDKGRPVFDQSKTGINPTEEQMFKDYLECILHNRENNDEKAALVLVALFFLVLSIVLLSWIVVLVFGLQPISSENEKGIKFTCNELETGAMRIITNNNILEPGTTSDSKIMLCLNKH
jgi:ABC-type multidrug transport system fused ATPase/permease subunit